MKKRAYFKILIMLALSLACAVCALAGVCSCAKKDDGGGGTVVQDPTVDPAKWDVYDGLALGFASDEDCPYGNIEGDKVVPELSCKSGERHYLAIDFEINAPQDNDGSGSVETEVRISPSSVVSATVQETNSGNVTEETADGAKLIKAVYKIPDRSSELRKIRLVIRLDPLKSSLADIGINFNCPDNMPAVKTKSVQKQIVSGYTEGLIFDGESVIGVSDKEIEKAVIPNYYGGEKIKGIAENAFGGCKNLKQVVMPDSVNMIGKGAFNGCASLESFHIGGGITELGSGVFRGCNALEALTVSESNPEYSGEGNCVLTKDGETVVLACKGSAIPDGVKVIGDYAFAECIGLAEISFPESVKEIGERAFSGCVGLNGVILPDGLETIGAYAFENCALITEAVIPNGVKSTGGSAFVGCSVEKATSPYAHIHSNFEKAKLKTLIITDGTAVGNTAFGGYGKIWSALESVTLPDSVTYVDDYAFMHCAKLKEINFGNGLTGIGRDAFTGCKALTEITFPDSLTGVGAYAFSQCSYLKTVNFGSSFNSLGNWSFYGCDRLKNYYFNGTTEQWGGIYKAPHWKTAAGGVSYTVHCTDGDYTGRC